MKNNKYIENTLALLVVIPVSYVVGKAVGYVIGSAMVAIDEYRRSK